MTTDMPAPSVTLHTDGACLGNPGPGGWAAILQWGEHESVLSGGLADTTNNQMELMAVIMGLEALKRPVSITVVSDSRYVLNGIQNWIAGWKRNGWKNAKKQQVANQELWQRLDAATQSHRIEWQWIKGHAGHPLNERCDELASAEARQF
jgi:ribonuclease HI